MMELQHLGYACISGMRYSYKFDRRYSAYSVTIWHAHAPCRPAQELRSLPLGTLLQRMIRAPAHIHSLSLGVAAAPPRRVQSYIYLQNGNDHFSTCARALVTKIIASPSQDSPAGICDSAHLMHSFVLAFSALPRKPLLCSGQSAPCSKPSPLAEGKAPANVRVQVGSRSWYARQTYRIFPLITCCTYELHTQALQVQSRRAYRP